MANSADLGRHEARSAVADNQVFGNVGNPVTTMNKHLVEAGRDKPERSAGVPDILRSKIRR